MIELPDSNYDIIGSVVLYNTSTDELQRAIRQFFEVPDTDHSKRHLCIIDNSERPLENPRFADDRITYYFANRNLGYGCAHNIAFRASRMRSKYNLIMNTDVRYAPETISILKSYLDSNPNAGLAAPKILNPDGTLQLVCRLLPTPWNIFLRRFFPKSRLTAAMDSEYELQWWNHNNIANIPFLSGSFLLARTELLSALGGFDERFFLYAEDVDLSRRIHEVSKTVYIPNAVVTHEFRRQNRRSIRGTWQGLVSHVQYFNKWGWFIEKKRRETNLRVAKEISAQLSQNRAS